MRIHTQKSDKSKHPFWNLEVIESHGKISIPAGKFYIQGKEYDFTAIENEPFPEEARLFVEKTENGADYFLDTTGYGEPNSFGDGIGAILVVWNENGEIHCLRSIENA